MKTVNRIMLNLYEDSNKAVKKLKEKCIDIQALLRQLLIIEAEK